MKILCKSIIDLNKQRYVIIKDDIENIIRNNIKEDIYIQRILEGMPDVLFFYENADTLLSFKKICRYYFNINPQATVRYISYYREQNDSEWLQPKE